MIPPLEEMDRRELVLLLSDQIKKVLIHRWDSPMEERRFVRELCSGEETSAVSGDWLMTQGFHGDPDSEESTCNAGGRGSTPGSGRTLEKGMATYSSVLAWRIP